MENRREIKCAITIAGSDSGGGAGIQADMLAFSANGVFGTSAIAAVTAQNPDGVGAVAPVPLGVFRQQLDKVYAFFKPAAAKTGMLFDADHILACVDFFLAHHALPVIVDPVMVSTSGSRLLEPSAEEALKKSLLPLAWLITPNLFEAEALLGEPVADMRKAARALSEKFQTNVLLKGGHAEGDDVEDILRLFNGEELSLKSRRMRGVDTHGGGCTLSAAITANVAKGESLPDACRKARQYLLRGMEQPVRASGRLFINHFPKK